MVAGSFFLTPATALRYERHDRKVKQLSKEEGLGIGKDKRKIDLREEYYVSILDIVSWTIANSSSSDSRARIWTTGSRKESSDCQERLTESWSNTAQLITNL